MYARNKPSTISEASITPTAAIATYRTALDEDPSFRR